MKTLSLLTFAALLTVTSCSHFSKGCCSHKEKQSCSKESCKDGHCKKDKKDKKECKGDSCHKKS
jgi:hypothetical protein